MQEDSLGQIRICGEMGHPLPQALQHLEGDAGKVLRLLSRAVQALYPRGIPCRGRGKGYRNEDGGPGHRPENLFNAGECVQGAVREPDQLYDPAESQRIQVSAFQAPEPVRQHRRIPHQLGGNEGAVLLRLYPGEQGAMAQEADIRPEGTVRGPGDNDAGHPRLPLQ